MAKTKIHLLQKLAIIGINPWRIKNFIHHITSPKKFPETPKTSYTNHRQRVNNAKSLNIRTRPSVPIRHGTTKQYKQKHLIHRTFSSTQRPNESRKTTRYLRTLPALKSQIKITSTRRKTREVKFPTTDYIETHPHNSAKPIGPTNWQILPPSNLQSKSKRFR